MPAMQMNLYCGLITKRGLLNPDATWKGTDISCREPDFYHYLPTAFSDNLGRFWLWEHDARSQTKLLSLMQPPNLQGVV